MRLLSAIGVFIFLGFSSALWAQERLFKISSKDSVQGLPKFTSSLGANLKLNGYFDMFGGLQDSETFNIGLINVIGDDDEKSFQWDLYQTQLCFDTHYMTKGGREIKVVVESDFWGGDGRMRLRKAYVESEHWQIGQNWNNFGDEDLWPNIMEWEGPPSGVWVRNPHIKYTNTFKQPQWEYALSLESPVTDYLRAGDLQPLLEEARQVTPDLTAAISYKKSWGHLRLSSILRYVRYRLDGTTDGFVGYGFSLSGYYRQSKNILQYQLVGGKGISAYMTSIAGLGYDGFPNIEGVVKPTPVFGGWIANEHFFTPRFHVNTVFGYTRYHMEDLERFVLIEDIEAELLHLNGQVRHTHYYGIFNIMYDIYERMTLGLELDYGVKNLKYDAYLETLYLNEDLSRDAMRISFGFMFTI